MNPLMTFGADLLSEVTGWGWDKAIVELMSMLDAGIRAAGQDATKKKLLEGQRDVWSRIKWEVAISDYRKNVLDNVSTTRLLGHPRPIDLSQIYTDVMVYDKQSAFRFSRLENFDTRNLQHHEDGFPRIGALDAVLSGKHLYLLGRPGAGKTTFLKHLAFLACEGKIKKTPIFIALREHHISVGTTALELICQAFDHHGLPSAQPFVSKLLESGRVLLLFDGLDEVADEQGVRKHLINELVLLARRYPKCQICVSCRIAATEYAFEQFEYLEVADFSEEQKHVFCERWFQPDDERRNRFLTQWHAPHNEGIRELGRTPLLLAFICLAYESTLELPHRRVDLYRDAVDALLRRWDSSRNVVRDRPGVDLPPHRYEPLLWELAADTFFSGAYIFRTERVARVIADWYGKLPEGRELSLEEAGELVRAVEYRTGLLVCRAKDTYSFSHLSIQEYLTAVAITNGRMFPSAWTFVNTRLMARNWREVFIFLTGLAPDASSLIRAMVQECVSTLHANPNWVEFRACLQATLIEAELQRETDIEKLATQAEARLAQVAWRPPVKVGAEDGLTDARLGLERLYRQLRLMDCTRERNLVALTSRVLARQHKTLPAWLMGTDAKNAKVPFGAYIYAVGLTVECARTGVCKDRLALVQSVVFGVS
ncbi:MAG: NACHT domain-containing protein [Burkholderiales bacterium]|nr:NACHT domain-containing protein [Burkholderiales bacterium]MBH2017807.1 NACHT domain-containing protein [Burkholderiales bacterium]